MKKSFLILSVIGLLVFILAGCGVNPDSIILSSPKDIVRKMNSDFEGNFTYLSHEVNEKSKYQEVKMNCELDGRNFEVTTSESHYVDIYFNAYYEKKGTFRTNYYAGRYEKESSTILKAELYEYFDYFQNTDGFSIYSCQDKNTVRLENPIKSINEYVDYIKKDGSYTFIMIVPFAKESDKNFELLKTGLWALENPEREYRWINGTIIYDPENKIPLDSEITTDYISELNLECDQL